MPEILPPEIARQIRVVVLDVDGVLTDGGVYMGEAGGEMVELKRFDILDQLGIKLLRMAGIHVSFISGRVSPANRRRAQELDVEFHEGPGGHKLDLVQSLLDRQGADWSELACVCDDLADMAILRRAALPVAVANAVSEVAAVAVWRTRRPGGHGAVREFSETLLRARGEWNELVAAYYRERDPEAT